jgi:uncharacterized protein YkuJ
MKPTQNKQEMSLIFSRSLEAAAPSFSGSFYKVEREILNLLLNEEYQKLRAMLSSASNENKKVFFERHGTSILYHAVVNSNDTEALKIIIENVSIPIVQELLRRNDSGILKGLLRIQYFLETYTMSGQTEEEVKQKTTSCHEKLRFLSVIDAELLSDFLEEHQADTYMSEPVTKIIKSFIPIKTQENFCLSSASSR